MAKPLVLLTTYPNDGRKLKRLITGILKKGLAKCIQRVNYVKSYYIWEGDVRKDEEKLVLMKTTSDQKEGLTSFIKQQHPYDVPELIRLDPDDVDQDYRERLLA